VAESIAQVQRAFSAYTVERELGSGGMATVYLAHDKKHDRKVAIKILHAELAAILGAERFLQEIRVTANLQHPHILGLIDSGVIGDDAGELRGRPYYVMPFVEGESLRQRLDKEQQLPISDSVRIATEVASALDYAHRHGVVHRDIKPENILLHDGSAIVADFGIALAVTQAGGARITQTGLSLGTPGYMSPEQAMGERTITARSDIYSLGAVTYEMLSGEPPFTGPTVQAVVARVMTEEPRPLTAQRRNVPAHVEAAVARALEKIPADRFSSAHEFGEALNNPSFARASAAAPREKGRNRRDKWMLYGAAGLAALFLATTLWGWMRPTVSKPVVRYQMVFDSTEALVPGASWWTRAAFSPDGSRLAYIGGPRGQILIRPRSELHATAIPGTEGANSPFFSPDGSRLGYLQEGLVRLAPISGGLPITVSDTLTGVAGASWGPDGFIYVDGRQSVPLLRVEAKPGAKPTWFTTLDSAKGEVDHTWPEVLPNGKAVLFVIAFTGPKAVRPGTTFAIGVAEIPSGKHRVLIQDATHPKYAASGRLLYVTPNRTLMTVPFDQNSQKVTGDAIPLVQGMRLGGWARRI
jgi:serine/threonine-protein kinase